MRYYYCPFYFPDAETEITRLGNLLKVTSLVGGSARLQPSALPPDFIPCKRDTGVVPSPTHCEKDNGILQAVFNWQMSTTGSQRSKSGGIDLVQVVEDIGGSGFMTGLGKIKDKNMMKKICSMKESRKKAWGDPETKESTQHNKSNNAETLKQKHKWIVFYKNYID